MKEYKINELFYSIQGEGGFTGTAAFFIRFAGCNLECDFCDTFFNPFQLMKAEDVWKQVLETRTTLVVCTGGEPMMQLDEEFINVGRSMGYTGVITVETNGTVNKKEVLEKIDYITCSPKYRKVQIERVDEMKFLMKGDGTFFLPEGQSLQDLERKADLLFIQPISLSKQATAKAVEFIKEHTQFKLSVQLHKVIGVN